MKTKKNLSEEDKDMIVNEISLVIQKFQEFQETLKQKEIEKIKNPEI